MMPFASPEPKRGQAESIKKESRLYPAIPAKRAAGNHTKSIEREASRIDKDEKGVDEDFRQIA